MIPVPNQLNKYLRCFPPSCSIVLEGQDSHVLLREIMNHTVDNNFVKEIWIKVVFGSRKKDANLSIRGIRRKPNTKFCLSRHSTVTDTV